MPNEPMPSFRDPSGGIWVWDAESHSYSWKPGNTDINRGEAFGGDASLFSPNQIEHSELPGVPELEGWAGNGSGGNRSYGARREFADPGEVLCPQCRESTDQPVCPLCDKDLTPEWNQFRNKDQSEDFRNSDPTTTDVASEFFSWPDRVPKRNRQKVDDSYPSMLSSLRWRLASRKISQDEFDDWDLDDVGTTEIGKWLQDRSGQLHFDHGMYANHEPLAERQGLRWPDDIGALGSIYNNGTADTQRVFPGHQYNHEGVQTQIGQAFGPVTLSPPLHQQGVSGKGPVFTPFTIQSGQWLVNLQPGQTALTGIAWVRERPHGPYKPNMILCAEHLQPEDYQLWSNGVKAIITGTGGLTSHAAYLASTEGIPVIVGLGPDYNKLESGNYLKIDPTTQTILVTPGASSKQNPDVRHQISDEIYNYFRERDPLLQQVGAILKPEYFSHIIDEQNWRLANDPSLADCPECHSPLTEKGNEKICYSCGNRQPIITIAMLKEAGLWDTIKDVGTGAWDAAKGYGEAVADSASKIPQQVGDAESWLGNNWRTWAPYVGEAGLTAMGLGVGGKALGLGGKFLPRALPWAGKGVSEVSPWAGNIERGLVRGAPAVENAVGDAGQAAKAMGWGRRLLGLGGRAIKYDAYGNLIDDTLHQVGGVMNGALGGGGMGGQSGGGYSTPQMNISLPGTISKTFGEEEDGLANKNRGENSEPESGSSPNLKEKGDGPEQLKDVGGGPFKHDEQHGQDLNGDQGDPMLKDKAMKSFLLNTPLILEYFNSEESGAEHPILKALDDLLEAAFPGYKNAQPETGETETHEQEESPIAEIEEHEDPTEEHEEKDDATKKKEVAKAASVWHFAYDPIPPGHGENFREPKPEEAGLDPWDYEGIGHGVPEPWDRCPECGGPSVNGVCERGCPPHRMDPDTVMQMEREKGPAYFASEKTSIQTMPNPVPGQGAPTQGQGQFPICPKCGYPHDPSMPCAASMSNPAGTPGAAVNPAPYAVGMNALTPPIPQKVVTKWDHLAGNFDDWTAASEEEEEEEAKHEYEVETKAEREQKAHSGNIHDPDEGFDAHIAAAIALAGDWDHEKKIQETPGDDSASHEHHHHHEWVDADGQPLQEGVEYEMHTSSSAIPDRITVLSVVPGKLTYTTHSGDVDYSHELSKQEADLDGAQFTAATSGIDSESGSDMGDIPPVRPGHDPIPQVTDISDTDTKVSSLEEYTGSFKGDQPDARSWLMEGNSSVDVDPGLMEKLAGKDFSPREQREFIDEGDNGPGARNLNRLDLEGTHYISDDLNVEDSLW